MTLYDFVNNLVTGGRHEFVPAELVEEAERQAMVGFY